MQGIQHSISWGINKVSETIHNNQRTIAIGVGAIALIFAAKDYPSLLLPIVNIFDERNCFVSPNNEICCPGELGTNLELGRFDHSTPKNLFTGEYCKPF